VHGKFVDLSEEKEIPHNDWNSMPTVLIAVWCLLSTYENQ